MGSLAASLGIGSTGFGNNESGALIHVRKMAHGQEGEERSDYVRAAGKSIARLVRNGASATHTAYFTFSDHLGSPVATMNGTTGVLETERYTPFGIAMDNPNALTDQAGFTGHIKDSATGLNYMQARYYDPVMGRFLSIDPVTFLDTGAPSMFNRYAYVGNDPINMIDPNGECGIGSNGLMAGVCPSDSTTQGYYDQANATEGYTELKDLDARLISENRIISVRSEPGSDNGEFSSSILAGDRAVTARIGDQTSQLTGVDANGQETTSTGDPLTRFIHEVVGHGGQWADLGSQGMSDLVRSGATIGANNTGIDPSQSAHEGFAMQAGNRFRAATNSGFRRTHHGARPLVVTGTRRMSFPAQPGILGPL